KEVGEQTGASRLPLGAVETRGCAISTLFGCWASLICDTYTVLAWNKIESALGASSSFEPHTGIQQHRRPGYTKEDQSQMPEAGL
uniref:Small integral membrane protein 2 n=1 Tax=Rhinolophus ferrumequinum TaxID=59479 RepID=A0A671FLJ8_RHIFE